MKIYLTPLHNPAAMKARPATITDLSAMVD
jgi:hypothetical protein